MGAWNYLSSEIYKAQKTNLGADGELGHKITDGVFIPLWKGKM